MNLSYNQIIQIKLGRVYYLNRNSTKRDLTIPNQKTGFYHPNQMQETEIIIKNIQNYRKNEEKIQKSKGLHQSRYMQESLKSSEQSALMNTQSEKSRCSTIDKQSPDTTRLSGDKDIILQEVEAHKAANDELENLIQGYTILIQNKGIFEKLVSLHKSEVEKSMFQYSDVKIRKRKQTTFLNLNSKYKYFSIGHIKSKHSSSNKKKRHQAVDAGLQKTGQSDLTVSQL